jgi:hypothetical protein
MLEGSGWRGSDDCVINKLDPMRVCSAGFLVPVPNHRNVSAFHFDVVDKDIRRILLPAVVILCTELDDARGMVTGRDGDAVVTSVEGNLPNGRKSCNDEAKDDDDFHKSLPLKRNEGSDTFVNPSTPTRKIKIVHFKKETIASLLQIKELSRSVVLAVRGIGNDKEAVLYVATMLVCSSHAPRPLLARRRASA